MIAKQADADYHKRVIMAPTQVTGRARRAKSSSCLDAANISAVDGIIGLL
jgi:hypothetical protein